MASCEAAYYLVHSLSDADFERKDADAAAAFGQTAALAGLRASFTSEVPATTRTPCRCTCAAAARSRGCSEREASR